MVDSEWLRSQTGQLDSSNTTGDRTSSKPQVTGEDLVAYAKKFIGVPYESGGRDPNGWDCAGFTWYVCKHFHIDIPEISEGQLQSGEGIGDDPKNAMPGDLVILRTKGKGGVGRYGHVMMYTHGGNVIHAHGGDANGTTNIQPISRAIPSTHYIAGIRRVVKPGVRVGVSAPVTGTTEEKQPGSFAKAKKSIKIRRLKEKAVFNPPQPNKKLFRLENYPNARGFIVRDPSIQTNFAGNSGWQSFETPYGFQFSFNPDSYSETYSAPNDGDPIAMMLDVSRGVPLLAANDMARFTFKLLLARFEDMRILRNENWKSYYPPNSITEEQREAILKYGTQSDIEYLFRLCNGEPFDTWHGKTSDWGMMLPTLSILSLGDSPGCRKVRGYIQSIGYDHKMLIAGMVPVYTELQITFSRLVDSYYDTSASSTSDTQPEMGGGDFTNEQGGGDFSTSTGGDFSGNMGGGNFGTVTKPGKTAKGDTSKVSAAGAPGGVLAGTKFRQNNDRHPDPDDGLDDASFVWVVFDKAYPGALSSTYQGRSAMMKRGKQISKNYQEGDLVFLGTSKSAAPSHVGIYTEDGKILHMVKGHDGPQEEHIGNVARYLGLDERPISVRRIMEKN